MKKNISMSFQIAAVFIGTIVGAGLASGQEIKQFFTYYGYKSFIGMLICFFVYIIVGPMIVDLSLKYNLNSYEELIKLVSPGFLGNVTDIIIGFFLLSSSAIILAGSGALLKQYFNISPWVGIVIMASISFITLLRDTKGLIEINSFIVPSLLIVITTIFVLYLLFDRSNMTYSYIKTIPHPKNNWLFSCFIYSGFNLLGCCGVLVPLSHEIGHKKVLNYGIAMGAVGLTFLSLIINLVLLLNVPYIYQYEIPLLYIVNRFGSTIQIILLIIILLEMFSTEVSDIYSLGKTMEHAFKIPYKKAVFIILLAALPISQFGFSKLISLFYPISGFISFIFILQCVFFYIREKKSNLL